MYRSVFAPRLGTLHTLRRTIYNLRDRKKRTYNDAAFGVISKLLQTKVAA
jgi:hypothetical protein